MPLIMLVRAIRDSDRQWLRDLISSEWGLAVVSISGAYDPSALSGFLAEEDGDIVGAVTYRLTEHECEIVTLNTVCEGHGVGTALLAAVRQLADERHRRLWLITSNENINAICFYQRRGMHMKAIHRDFVDVVRHWKPELSDNTGGISFRHAIEFSY